MKKPTELECKMQFTLKGCTDETQHKRFLAYYYSVGWYVGNSKMRSWKAAVAGWILRMNDFKKEQPPEQTKRMYFTKEEGAKRLEGNHSKINQDYGKK